MRRRAGTGTIERRRQRDGSIRFMPRLPDAPRTPLGTFATYDEAAKILDACNYELATGALKTSKTLDAFASTVFERRELDGYRSVVGERERWKYVAGNAKLERKRWSCADWPLEAIKRKDVVAWTRELAALGLAHSTRVNALTVLRAVFEAALEDEIIESNPAREVRVKKHGVSEDTMRPLTLEQLNALFWTADDEGKHLIALAAGSGIRSSELAACRAVDVYLDDDEPHLMIRHGSPGKPRKNGKVHRVPIFGFALEALRSWMPPPNERGLYFATSTASAWKKKAGCVRRKGAIVPRKRWARWLELAGIDRRVRWHDLRHTCATLLLTGALGRAWSIEEICDLLGHSSIAVTERYAKHLNMNASRAARCHADSDERRVDRTDPDIEGRRSAHAGPERAARERVAPDARFDVLPNGERSHREAIRHAAGSVSERDESRLRDLNSRPTVYEIRQNADEVEALRGARGSVVELLKVATHGDVSRRTVDVAGALLDAIDEELHLAVHEHPLTFRGGA